MIQHKAGVRLDGVRAELFHGTHVAEALWAQAGVATLVITAGREGQHTKGSAHYRGEALDLRTNTLPPDQVRGVIGQLQSALGPDYFILYEAEGTPNAHCHLEWRPQEAY